MFDIEFYMKVYDLKKRLMDGEQLPREYVVQKMEEYRSPKPVVYNIETTNACNMRCEMCPRTTMMTRPVKTMSLEHFSKIVQQLDPFTAEQWTRWEAFAQEKYGIAPD